MNTIKISSFSNEAASKTKGEHLKDLLLPYLSTKQSVAVDFSGIDCFASPFFNNSFSSLALIYGFDLINQIKLVGINEIGYSTYTSSIENAKLLSENPEYSNSITKIISDAPKKME